MDTDSLYLDSDECIPPSKRAERTEKQSKDCREDLRADAKNNFFPVLAALNIRNMTRENQGCSRRRRSDVPKCCASVVKLFCCNNSKSQTYKFSSKGLNKCALEDSGDGPMANHRQVLDESVNLKSTSRGFETINRTIAFYEQTKKKAAIFNKRGFEWDGIHTKPLNLYRVIH